jgi:hypothetical protein
MILQDTQQDTQKEEGPWERLPEENARAYQYALAYFQLGPTRSLEQVSQQFQKTLRQMKYCSQKFGWVQRAVAYGDWQEHKKQKAREAVRRQEAEKWAARASEEREKKWLHAEMLLTLVERQTQISLTRVQNKVERDPQGRETKLEIHTPNNWTIPDAVAVLMSGHAFRDRAQRNGSGTENPAEEPDEFNIAP